ncbi:RicAFT regulatory complex protein RicA family protein [Paenibacillus sp. GCM10027626]|uniref:RicAFT regulatory complex protein RicA family protein n=1 Tax=Paenibacillus sp. GCM10027626 TaxID=3273411 RepID=UPI00363BD4E6
MANEQTAAHSHDHEGGCSVPSFRNEDFIVRKDIMAKTKELAEMLFTSEEVQMFRRSEQQIQDNERVQDLIARIKKKQKEIVAFETTFKNPEMVAKIEKEIDALQDELDEIPIIGQFQQSQVDVNYLLQTVVAIIRDTVADKITMEDVEIEEPENCSE